MNAAESEEAPRPRTASHGVREDVYRQLETAMAPEPNCGLTAQQVYDGRDMDGFGDWSYNKYTNRLSQMAGMQKWKVVRVKGKWMIADFAGINHKRGTQRNPIDDDSEVF